MKIAIGRGPGQFGGIFRRFRELCRCARGRHDVFGLMPLAEDDTPLDEPVRTYAYSRRLTTWGLLHVESHDALLTAGSRMIDRIAADLARERPDVVLANDTDLKGATIVAAARRLGIPVTTFVAGLATFDEYATRPSMQHLGMAESYCLSQSDRLIFPSAYAARMAGERIPALAPHVVIYNGIADAFLQPVAVPRRNDCIGASMRFSPVKNPEALGRVAAALRPHGITTEVITTLPSTARGGGALAMATILEPTLDSDALAARYASWRAVVAPSRFEASGNVPMEALALGTPTIVTNAMGVAELFHQFGLGHWVVDVDDIDTTVARVLDAAPVPERVRAEIRTAFNWPDVAERLIAALATTPRER